MNIGFYANNMEALKTSHHIPSSRGIKLGKLMWTSFTSSFFIHCHIVHIYRLKVALYIDHGVLDHGVIYRRIVRLLIDPPFLSE